MRRALFALAGCLVACGGTDITKTEARGSLPGGQPFFANHAIYNHDHSGEVVVLMSLDPDACQHLVSSGLFGQSRVEDQQGGVAPSLMLVLNGGHFAGNDLRTIGDDLDATLDPGAAATDEFSLVGRNPCVRLPDAGLAPLADGGELCADPVPASAGKAHLVSNDDPQTADAQATGDFDLTFAPQGKAAGTFIAKPCGNLKRAGIDCGCTATDGAGLLPLAALLLLGRRKRRG